MLLRRLKYPCTTGLILRRTYPELYKSHIVKLFEEYPHTRRWYNEQRKEMIFPNGSRLFFGSAEHAKDMSAFYSAEFADIMPDEAQEFSQGELEQLSGSLRCTSNPDITPKMVFPFMPGISETGLPPKGLPFLKRVFVDQLPTGKETLLEWKFLQAFGWDNIEWARKALADDGCTEEDFYSWSSADRREYFITRTEYGKNISALTDEALRDAWLDGKWTVFKGQYFSNFIPKRHVISREEARQRMKPWHTRWLSGDWGFDHPHAIYWHVKDENDRVITYREAWGREVSEQGLGELIGQMSVGEKFSAFPFSVDAGRLSSRDPGRRHSIASMIAQALPKDKGIPAPHPIDDKPGTRVSGWRLMSQFLDADMWQIVGEDCPKLVEQIPTLIRNPEKTEDVLKVDFSENTIGDDAADAVRYGLFFMFGSSAIKPFDVRIKEALAQLPVEGPERFIKHMQLKHEEKRTNAAAFYLGGGGPRRPRRH